MDAASDQVRQVVAAVLASAKYRHISPDLVRRVASQELDRQPSPREAAKATRSRLHQVAGAYLNGKMDYAGWLEHLREARQSGSPEAFRAACRAVMGHHASTRERLPILDQFYATVLASVPPPRSVLDLACGLNPLSIPWMPLAENARYYAVDIYEDMIDFLGGFMALAGCEGYPRTGDVLQGGLEQRVDLALLLKAIPCLEQVDGSAGLRLLDAIHADDLLVSFPVRALGGGQKGMVAHYEAHFRELIAGKPWTVRRFEFATELAFLVSK
jgi:16S rRNA (guanine(1405)-N(7))-methyltransferase